MASWEVVRHVLPVRQKHPTGGSFGVLNWVNGSGSPVAAFCRIYSTPRLGSDQVTGGWVTWDGSVVHLLLQNIFPANSGVIGLLHNRVAKWGENINSIDLSGRLNPWSCSTVHLSETCTDHYWFNLRAFQHAERLWGQPVSWASVAVLFHNQLPYAVVHSGCQSECASWVTHVVLSKLWWAKCKALVNGYCRH